MTTYNKTTLKTFFENGDIPTGQNYSDFIDSQVNIVDTEDQDMAGNLSSPKIITAKISALNANFTGIVSAAAFSINAFAANSGTFSGIVSAVAFNGNIQGGTGSFSSVVSANVLNVATGIFESVAIISAAGTTQAAAALITASINRLQGVTDGSATGFILPSPQAGRVSQYVVNETAASANLWPAIGCAINGNAANTVFGMLAHTSYEIVHTYVSGYGVK